MAMNRKTDNANTFAAPTADGRTISLRRRIQTGLLLVVLLTVLTGGGLAIHLTATERIVADGVSRTTMAPENGGHQGLMMRVRYGLLGGTFLALTALATIYILIVRYILHPLEHTAAAARQMVNGRLDATVPVQDTDEIGHIGEMFNDMGVNLQELIVLVWNQSGSALTTLEGLSRKLDNRHAAQTKTDIQSHLQSVRQNLGTMQTVARSFDLYDVLLTGQKAVARENLIDRVN